MIPRFPKTLQGLRDMERALMECDDMAVWNDILDLRTEIRAAESHRSVLKRWPLTSNKMPTARSTKVTNNP